MAETQSLIPQALIDRVRAGKAALVVGSNIGALAGLASWKKVLERLRDDLETRGQPGDKEAADDVAALLKKGRLVSASSFLARRLGGERCDEIHGPLWKTPDPLPEAIQVLGRIPVKAVWTVHPGDLVERAVAAGSPEGWPAPRVASYENADELDTRRRYVLHLLGEMARPDSYVLVPISVRRALASADAYRDLLADLYRDGTLILVGFRIGDPDLTALLDRVLGQFEVPTGVQHYFVGAGLGPVDTEELEAEHHMQVVPLEGRAGDEAAESLTAFLTALADECAAGGLALAVTRPADDDLEGWIARLHEDPADAEAQEALDAMEARAREAGEADRLVEILLARVEAEPDAGHRAGYLREVARTFEKEVGDLPRAFTALVAALKESPGDEDTLREAERLAGKTEGWGELVADLAAVVPQITDKAVAAGLWVRLGRWYGDKLRHHDYAIASLREALKLDAGRLDARELLEELYRKQQKWGELAEELATHADVEPDAARKVDVLLALGDLYETQLASTAKAIEAYEKVVAADAANGDALAALERLYRRGERWGRLAAVLEQRAEALEAGDPAHAATLRKELATLRSEKLGDVEGAIARHEAASEKDERDLDALRALEKLYEKVGRFDDYLRTLERLAENGPENERAPTWRRLAAEVEDREGGAERAVGYYEKVLAIEPGAADAYRSLERLHRVRQDWDALVELHERHVREVTTPAQKVELWVTLATLLEQELRDPHKAILAHANALDLAADHRESLAALARLYRRVEDWPAAVSACTRFAEQLGPKGADLWFEAGEIQARHLDDAAAAEAMFVKALEVDASHLPAMTALIELYKKRRDWERAVQLMLEAERHSQNRLEKVRLLHGAALIEEEALDRPERALELHQRVLALDPEHVEAGVRVADSLVAAGKWLEAEPVLEMLARKADPQDRVEKARRHALLGRTAEALGHVDKAAKHYRLAVETDLESLEAALGLARLLYARKEWAEAERHYREVLARHRPALAEGQVVDTWNRIGVCARGRGETRAAEDAFRRALERDPTHRPSLRAVIELATERADWKAVVEAKRAALQGASEDERATLYEEIGDHYADKLDDPVTGLGAYLEALKLRPRSHVILHKTLDIYTEQKSWRHAVETLAKLAEMEKDAAKRAKYFYAAAVIARDELKEPDEAVSYFTQALDDAPTMPKAFEAIERILGERNDWKGLARAYRTMIKRLGDRATPEQLLALWGRLGDIAREKLEDREAAITAYEVAIALEPGNLGRHEHLAALYLEAGPDRADRAIAELQILLKKHPDRLDLYRKLAKLYSQTDQTDKAYCLAAALVFLGQADEEAQARYTLARPRSLPLARRRLTEELWQKAILHPREDRALNGIFASLMASLAATTAQPRQALNLNPKQQADPEKDSRPVARVFRYAVQTLGIAPQPELYLREGVKDGIRAANMAEKGMLATAVLIGEPYVGRSKAEPEVAFDVAKKLAYFRPDRYVMYALPTLPKLMQGFHAALAATGHAPADGDDVQKLAAHIKRTVPQAVLEQVGMLAGKLTVREADAAVHAWLTATDLTADRAGFILACDLETAARLIATEQGVVSALSAKDRLRELLAYSVSEEYFAVRRHLGLEV